MPTIEARITKVAQKADSDWFKIVTDHNTVGTEREPLETKLRQLASEAHGLMQSGDVSVIKYSSNPKTVNGNEYQNYRYEGAQVRSSAPATSEIPVEAATKTDDGTPARIAISSGYKLFFKLVALMPDAQREQAIQDFETQDKIAAHYANRILTWRAGGANAEAQIVNELRQMADDDIPFGEPKEKPAYGEFPSGY